VNRSEYHNRVAVISGASSGLGESIAVAFLADGYRVVITGRDAARLTDAQNRIAMSVAGAETRISPIVCDATNQESVRDCFGKIAAEMGRLDVLVNCVGRSDRGQIENLALDRFRELIDANVVSTLLCSQAALPLLRQSRGVVVNIGSLSSKVGARYLGGYSAAKHALAGLTQQMRLEWLPMGVHVGLVNPGPIRRPDAGKRYSAAAGDLPESAKLPAGGAKLRGLDPQRVAAAVLRCAKRRQKDVIMPGYLRLMVAIGHAFPAVGDWLLLRFTGGDKRP
jgi:NAD(P)-dependent dehydrogenase (short-subunit alcohol dehydrogenase family)